MRLTGQAGIRYIHLAQLRKNSPTGYALDFANPFAFPTNDAVGAEPLVVIEPQPWTLSPAGQMVH